MSKQLLFQDEGRRKILSGVEQLARAVKVTLGPKGRNVVIDKKFGSPTITKDGVTVAKEIDLEDPFENMGAQMVKEVAEKTSDIAGDGTTTATIAKAEEVIRRIQSQRPQLAEDALGAFERHGRGRWIVVPGGSEGDG